jgi:hypothetical protein
VIRLSAPVRTRSSSACGGPCQNRPDSSTFVSTTARTLPPFGTHRLYLRVDLVHRHGCDVGGGDAVGDREQRVRRLPAFDRGVR